MCPTHVNIVLRPARLSPNRFAIGARNTSPPFVSIPSMIRLSSTTRQLSLIISDLPYRRTDSGAFPLMVSPLWSFTLIGVSPLRELLLDWEVMSIALDKRRQTECQFLFLITTDDPWLCVCNVPPTLSRFVVHHLWKCQITAFSFAHLRNAIWSRDW